MEEEAASNRGFWDVLREELPDVLGDLTGVNDVRDCFTKFDLWACAGIVPWGRMLKLVASAGKVFRAVRKALHWEDRVNAARHTLGNFVKLDDVVLATDPETGRTEARAVVATWVHDNEPTRTELTIDTDGTAGSATATLEAPDWHRIWVPDLNAWVPIANITVGNWLRTSAGTWVQIIAIRQYTSHSRAHDLTVTASTPTMSSPPPPQPWSITAVKRCTTGAVSCTKRGKTEATVAVAQVRNMNNLGLGVENAGTQLQRHETLLIGAPCGVPARATRSHTRGWDRAH